MKINPLLSRRRLLYAGLLGLTACGSTWRQPISLGQIAQVWLNLGREFPVEGDTPLKQRAAAKGLIYGAEAGTFELEQNPDLVEAILRECAILVNDAIKWEFIRPAPSQFEFGRADQFAQFTREQNLLGRGHTLVWHYNLPQWFSETVTRQNVESVLVEHVQTVTRRYAGQMHSWDVVNEAVEPKDGRSDQLRRSPWLELLGPEYVDLAFRIAAEADPDALLVYNDYGVEYGNAEQEARRTGILKLLERLKAQGTPVHALGIQAHMVGDQSDFAPNRLRRFLADVASLDLKILITELDVIDQKLPADVETRDRVVASVYEDLLSVVLDEPAVIAVLTWGLTDRHTWISSYFPRPDGLPVRPLPFDQAIARKSAWNAMARAFDQAASRPG